MSLKISNTASPAGGEYEDLLALEKSNFDRIVTKTCTLKPIPKLTKPVWRKEKLYSINNYGLGNYGYEVYSFYSFDKPYVISVTGRYKELRKIVTNQKQPDFLEINISCPNSNKEIVSVGDLCFLPFKTPFGIKLPPLFSESSLSDMAGDLNILRGFQKNLKYVVCCNTLPMEGGGVGGKILKPVSLYNIQHLSKHLRKDIQIWGCGGVSSVQDLLEYERSGCYGVQIDTTLVEHVNEIIQEYKS